MEPGIIVLDLHGKNTYQAKIAIDSALRRSKGAYRIRVIHGSTHGDAIKRMVSDEYGNHSKVVRIERGANAGQTDLVLKELW